MRQHVIREHQLSEFMEDALKEKQFLVYLQPTIALIPAQ